MTKKELAAKVAEELGTPKKDGEKVIDAVLSSIIKAIADGENVTFRGFGNFTIKTRKGRIGRNPNTGESIEIPDKKIVHFTVGKDLNEAVK